MTFFLNKIISRNKSRVVGYHKLPKIPLSSDAQQLSWRIPAEIQSGFEACANYSSTRRLTWGTRRSAAISSGLGHGDVTQI